MQVQSWVVAAESSSVERTGFTNRSAPAAGAQSSTGNIPPPPGLEGAAAGSTSLGQGPGVDRPAGGAAPAGYNFGQPLPRGAATPIVRESSPHYPGNPHRAGSREAMKWDKMQAAAQRMVFGDPTTAAAAAQAAPDDDPAEVPTAAGEDADPFSSMTDEPAHTPTPPWHRPQRPSGASSSGSTTWWQGQGWDAQWRQSTWRRPRHYESTD